MKKNNLLDKRDVEKKSSFEVDVLDENNGKLVPNNFYVATFEILIAMGIGTIISSLLEKKQD